MRTVVIASAALVATLVACGTAARHEEAAPARETRGDSQTVLGEFDGQIVPQATSNSVGARPLLYTVQLNPVADGKTGTNPNSTIELYSDTGLVPGSTCGTTADIETTVNVLSFMPEQLRNVQVGFVYITPTANKICTALASGRGPKGVLFPDAALDPTFGIIDYSSIGSVYIGDYLTHRPGSSVNYPPNGAAVGKTWAFTLPSNQFFVWRARVVADLRPYPAQIGSPYVDAATADTPLPTLIVVSDDSQNLDTLKQPSIVNAVHFSTSFNADMSSPIESNATATMIQSGSSWWGTGSGPTAAATQANAGRTVYVQMQNEWLDGSNFSVLGQVIPATTGTRKSFVVTQAASVPALDANGTTASLPFTPASQVTAAEIEIFEDASRAGDCSGLGNTFQALKAIPKTSPYVIASGLVSGTTYCYHVRNTFKSPQVGLLYPGSWSAFTNFVAP